MKLADLTPRAVLLVNAQEVSDDRKVKRLTDEQRRENNRKNVYAFRQRNRERWNEIQRNSRKRKSDPAQ